MKLVAVFLVCIFSFASAGTPWIPKPRTDEYFANKHNDFVNNTEHNGPSIRVIFYGDSITDFWTRSLFDQYYTPLGAVNYGISADLIEHVLWRIINGEVTERLNNLALCVLMIGTNNIVRYDGEDPDDVPSVARGISTIVTELRQRVPNMKILLLGVLPRNSEDVTNYTSSVNDIIRGLDNGNTIRFLDMKDHFYRGDGTFNEELYSDRFTHLTEAGYRKWAEVMDPLFREMLQA